MELISDDCSVSLHPINDDGTCSGQEQTVYFDPADKVHAGWSILGRATTVLGARTRKGNKRAREGASKGPGEI